MLGADRHSEDILKDTLREGRVYQAEITQPRNVKHHRLYWVLCHKIAEALPETFEGEKGVDAWIKLATGHSYFIPDPFTGEPSMVPGSIAFHAMDQVQFDAFYALAIKRVCERLIPDMDNVLLRDEVEKVFTTRKA